MRVSVPNIARELDTRIRELRSRIDKAPKHPCALPQHCLCAWVQSPPSDPNDARYWKEESRSLVTTVEPWLAMSQLVHYLGEEVPTKDGRKTHWHFACFEGMKPGS